MHLFCMFVPAEYPPVKTISPRPGMGAPAAGKNCLALETIFPLADPSLLKYHSGDSPAPPLHHEFPMSMSRHLLGLLVAGFLCLPGCGRNADSAASWKRLSPAEMTDTERKQKDLALAAKDDMFTRLLARLKQEIARGPGLAVAVCREEAPRIAAEVAEAKGVKIGRTALKLRNPKNQPPSWAKELMDQAHAEPAFLKNAQGDLAAFLPIKLQAQCLLCHGSRTQIPDEVRTALAQNYPADRATGFKEGDLRGWFWIEVAKGD